MWDMCEMCGKQIPTLKHTEIFRTFIFAQKIQSILAIKVCSFGSVGMWDEFIPFLYRELFFIPSVFFYFLIYIVYMAPTLPHSHTLIFIYAITPLFTSIRNLYK